MRIQRMRMNEWKTEVNSKKIKFTHTHHRQCQHEEKDIATYFDVSFSFRFLSFIKFVQNYAGFGVMVHNHENMLNIGGVLMETVQKKRIIRQWTSELWVE